MSKRVRDERVQIADRVAIAFLLWLIMIAAVAWGLGPERKYKWFRQRDQRKSFLNRRGFLGEYIHFGYPCTIEGWMVFAGLMSFVLITAYIAIFV